MPGARDPFATRDAAGAGREPVGAPELCLVGVGASAGGLAALEALFEHLPPDAGLAYLVVTHQAQGSPGLLAELLARRTRLTVLPAEEGAALAPDRVYVPAPGVHLAVRRGRLVLSAAPPGLHLPIDHLFRSLAADAGARAVGVVLSGTGSDGTEGVRAIKAEGGLALAQDQSSAGHPGMPASAAATGVVDHVLPPEGIARELLAWGRRARAPQPKGGPGLAEPILQRVYQLLRQRTGRDFAHYKPGTVCRRIERRVLARHAAGGEEYLRLLAEEPDELDRLFQELLIGVTSFFRDPQAFERLTQEALPQLLAGRPDGHRLRAWVPGCSTGEEAYSLAIGLQECLERLGRRMSLQVFATDINARAIDAARGGLFAQGIATDVSPARLERFFQPEGGHLRIAKAVREQVVFAVQDALEDPPFTRLDLISCRNLLIYLQPAAQCRLLGLFHWALRPDGLLVLGTSESLGGAEALFTPVDRQAKIYRRAATRDPVPGLPLRALDPPAGPELATSPWREEAGRAGRVGTSADSVLLELYAPPSLVVTPRGEILHVRGRTGRFLEPAEGQPTLNLLSMAREGLGPELALALRQATGQAATVRRSGVRVKCDDTWQRTDLVVHPLTRPEMGELLLVCFEAAEPEPAGGREPGEGPQGALELELQRAKEGLQSALEELGGANQELQATNEELQSTNEELQSANEELETSKEELQALNEALQASNAQLQEKVLELSRARDDMTNLLDGTGVATVFLDAALALKRFTPQARRVLELAEGDAGRPLADLAARLERPGLVADAAAVLASLAPRELEVRGADGSSYLTRLLPYRTSENRLDGLVITFQPQEPREVRA